MEKVKLSNNVEIPALGLGTFQLEPSDAQKSVETALKAGYRLIDTANAYCNEIAVGRGIKNSGLKRKDVFVSTKLWPTVYENKNAVDDTLKRLGVDYLDLLFIHQPAGNFVEGYRQLERAYKEGKIRSIGISNFHGKKLKRLLENAEIKPHVIQLEAHPYCTEDEIMQELKPYGTRLMSWYPLGHGDSKLLNEEIFVKLAEKYGKTPAQVILRWHTQMGFIVIPGSKNPEHIKANKDIFDFALSDDEMDEIKKLKNNVKYYNATDESEERFATVELDFDRD